MDAIVIVDIREAVPLKACCREFRRVLRNGGTIFGCASFMGLGGTNDPLDVGEFMIKTKFSLDGRPYLDRETLKNALSETFDYVDVASMGHMTAFVSGLNPIPMQMAAVS